MTQMIALPSVLFLVFRRLRAPLIILIIAYAISVLGFTLIPGEDDQGNPWRMDFFHAFYFVSFMGSTIGFGELPYPFTGAQRLWTLFTIYTTVISWLYAIGALIALLRDRGLQQAISRIRTEAQVLRLKEPFYLVCGYGEAGRQVVALLSAVGKRTVVIESSEETLHRLELEDISFTVPALCADATIPQNLKLAGLTHPQCQGVIAVTGHEEENLKIAIASKLLNRDLPLICRTITDDTADNMQSFGTNHIVNPFNIFAWHFGQAFNSPGQYLLNDWLSKTEHQLADDPVFPPRGKWILCGFGKFGKVMCKHLLAQGNSVTVVVPNPDNADAPPGSINGRGTEAVTLTEADVQSAVGIVAGTDHDANNLSIIVTARDLNSDLFCVARQNLHQNAELFKAARLDMVANQNRMVASRIMSLLTTPLTTDFLYQANQQSPEWSNELISRISGVISERAPSTWVLRIGPQDAPAVIAASLDGSSIKIGDLLRQPNDRKTRLPGLVLMLRRNGIDTLTPDVTTVVRRGDHLLFCGDPEARRKMHRIVATQNIMNYILSGTNKPVGTFWKWVSNQ